MSAVSTERDRTMKIRALHRLTRTELGGLGIALQEIETLESTLIMLYPQMRRVAEAETRSREARSLVGPGPYASATTACRDIVRALTTAREETEMLISTRRRKP